MNIPMMQSINAMTKKPHIIQSKEVVNKVFAAAKRRPTIERLKRTRSALSRGEKFTILRLMYIENVSRATAGNDLQILAKEGFAKFIMAPYETSPNMITTKLYSLE